MQDLDKEFDLKFRAALDGAEEEVPQHVWDAVSKRLGRRRAAALWARRGAAGLAAAAALALAVVLGGNLKGGTSDPLTAQPQQTLLAEAAETPSSDIPETAAAEETPAPQETGAAVTRRSYPVRRDVVPGIAVADAEETTPVQETPEAQKPEETAPSQAKEATSPKKTDSAGDPFARMAYEDSHRKADRRISVGANGLVGTNDHASAGTRASGPMAVSGNTASKEGVSEGDESIYGVPVSFGLSARFYLSDRFAIGAGVNYSVLSRSFSGTYTTATGYKLNVDDIAHNVQYVGVPVNFYFDILSNDVVDLYAFAGGSIEKCVSNKYRIPARVHSDLFYSDSDLFYKGATKGLQYSAALGLGVQFNFTDHFGIYVDPSARYWMGKDQPKTIRTQQPLMFNIEVGVRFEL